MQNEYRSKNKRIFKVTLLMFCILAMFLSIMPMFGLTTSVQTSAPDATKCTIYNYNSVYNATSNPNPYAPTLYMWGVTEDVTVRAYTAANGGELLGSASQYELGLCCVVPLDASLISSSGGVIYISQQASGELESERVSVAYSKAATPTVTFNVYKLRDTVASGAAIHMTSSKGLKQASPSALTEGNYYVVDVMLNNFQYLQSLSLPIKYDPDVWQLAKITGSSTSSGTQYKLSGSTVSAGGEGTLLSVFANTLLTSSTGDTSAYSMGGNPNYGIGIYEDYVEWQGNQSVGGTSTALESPYVNTDTGLVKLAFTTSNDAPNAIPSTASKFIRLYFKCLATPTSAQAGTSWTDSPLLHFATEEDIPEGVTSNAEQRMYYCATSPTGVTAAIQMMNVLAPPLSVQEASPCSEELSLTLSAEEMSAAPLSISESDQLTALLENQVKIYNYTNYGGYGTLDYDNGKIQDILLLTPSADAAGAARLGDSVKVYQADGTLIAGPTEVTDGEGGIRMLLGTDNLSPDGGEVYVAVSRSGVESAKVAVSYTAEVSRDVYFRVYSSGDQGYSGEDFDDLTGGAMKVERGDQIQVRLYFDNFEDLLSYTFGLHFDPSVVQASDSEYYMLLEDGYISEDMFKAGEGSLAIGEDLTEVTFNESVIYDLQTRYESASTDDEKAEIEAEIESVMELFGIATRDEFEQLAADVAVKYSVGADTIAWKGGLLFTGPARAAGTNGSSDPGRDESTLYPYVDNEGGLIKVSSASLTRPPLTLHSGDETGYHFLTMYFVAIGTGDPEFRLATSSDLAYDAANPDGGDIVLAGPGRSAVEGATTSAAEDVSSMPYTIHWEAHSMEHIAKTYKIDLLNGNALESDNDEYAMFLYNGESFRDPGFMLRDTEGRVLDSTYVTRYFINENGAKVVLPTYSDTEVLTPSSYFHVRTVNGALKYSDTYELIYEYTYVSNTLGDKTTVSVSRNVHVIFMRGDASRDGKITLFDEQQIVNMLNAKVTVSDTLYLTKTADANSDGVVDELDRNLIFNMQLGLDADPIVQDYVMPVIPEPEVSEPEVSA